MKKRTRALCIIIILSTSLLSISGCIEENNQPSSESFQTILEKATAIVSVYYELGLSTIIVDTEEQTTEMKIWEKGNYLKQTENTTAGGIITSQTIIRRPDGIYRYDDEKQSYEFDPQFVIRQPTIVETANDLLHNQTLTILGTETINEVSVTVIQYTPSEIGNGTTITLWIWNEKGVPFRKRSITKSDEITVTTDTKYINYVFAEIPESIFSIE